MLNKGAAQKWYDYWTAIIMLTAKGDIDDRREVHTPWRRVEILAKGKTHVGFACGLL
ncbi:MAG TPA: hypothetical protein VJQ26_12715 [Ktedonobacteraceae bacterium]|nr:hypothetical protein [Ktedonobacteraceae bacterium]